MEVLVMTAKELLNDLEALRRERADFDDLGVYVCVIDRRSYDEEQAILATDDTNAEMVETVIGEGSAYSVVVPTDIDKDGKKLEPYVLIQAVEMEDED